VQVVVRVRPTSEPEIVDGCRIVAIKTPGEPQLVLANNSVSAEFTFDEVFYTDAPQSAIFESQVQAMVDGTLQGLNQTILGVLVFVFVYKYICIFFCVFVCLFG
jgi:hypothetical protein